MADSEGGKDKTGTENGNRGGSQIPKTLRIPAMALKPLMLSSHKRPDRTRENVRTESARQSTGVTLPMEPRICNSGFCSGSVGLLRQLLCNETNLR